MVSGVNTVFFLFHLYVRQIQLEVRYSEVLCALDLCQMQTSILMKIKTLIGLMR